MILSAIAIVSYTAKAAGVPINLERVFPRAAIVDISLCLVSVCIVGSQRGRQ